MNTKYKTPILLIEDNPGDAKLAEIYLEESGIKYEFFHRGTLYEGLEFLERTPVDLVILDMNLPDSAGFKTVTTYFERASHIPVIVVTGMNNEIIGNQAIKAGAQDFLIKGQFDAKLFGRSVRYSLQRSKVQLKLEETAKELEINRKRFLEAQAMAHFGTWEMDLVSNEMKWTDEVFRIFGYQPGKISPSFSTYLGYVHPEDLPQVEAFFENASKDGKLHQVEHRIVVEGTSTRYVVVQAKIQLDEGSEKIFLVGGIQDITIRKVSEKLLLEKNISNKTAKIQEEALAELSFQIRTPLSSIVNLLFLLENTALQNGQSSYIKDLKTSTDDLSIAVNNLLNFTVMVSDAVKIEEDVVNIREFLQGVQNVVKIKADSAKVAIRFDLDEKLPQKVFADPKKLTQILYNLIDNAIRYTKEHGLITVSLAASETSGNKLSLIASITDSGIGMSAGKVKELLDADKLLESEQTFDTDKKRPLGVAIVNKLVKTLGGHISIESKEFKGTTVKVSLPVKAIRQAKLQAGETPEMPLKILLVEDHYLNQIATRKVLTSWSDLVSVDIAENGLIAVEKFKEYGYDLVLMDIQMPVMNGLDAAKKIREFSDVPIIALTANSTKQEQDKCFEIGMNDYLGKPFKPIDLYSKIMGLMAMVMN
jgi:CheY-like chemotaxis protein